MHRFLLKYLESIRKRKIGHAWQHADFPRELIALRFRCLIYAPLRIQNYVLNRGRARFLCKQVYNEPHFAFAKNAHYATEFMCFPWRHSRIAATFEVSSTSLAPRIVVLVAVALWAVARACLTGKHWIGACCLNGSARRIFIETMQSKVPTGKSA